MLFQQTKSQVEFIVTNILCLSCIHSDGRIVLCSRCECHLGYTSATGAAGADRPPVTTISLLKHKIFSPYLLGSEESTSPTNAFSKYSGTNYLGHELMRIAEGGGCYRFLIYASDFTNDVPKTLGKLRARIVLISWDICAGTNLVNTSPVLKVRWKEKNNHHILCINTRS